MNKCINMIKRFSLRIEKPSLGTLAVVGVLGFHALGVCGETSGEMNALAEQGKLLMNLIFSKPIATFALVFGLAIGTYQSFASGSFKPAISYTGICALPLIIPKVIPVISALF